VGGVTGAIPSSRPDPPMAARLPSGSRVRGRS
jgi:hypothetical protein